MTEVIGPFTVAWDDPRDDHGYIVLGPSMPAGTHVLRMWAIRTTGWITESEPEFVQLGAGVGTDPNIDGQALRIYDSWASGQVDTNGGTWTEAPTMANPSYDRAFLSEDGLLFIYGTGGCTAGSANIYALVQYP